MKIYKIASPTDNHTINIGNIGSLNNSNDKNRIYVVSDWLSRNDPQYIKDKTVRNDHVNLSHGRDFLEESNTYDIVILQHIFNPSELKGLGKGEFQISPNHTSANWIAKLAATNADYIFVWGGYSEVGAWWLGNMPGYSVVETTAYDMTVYRKNGLSQIKVEEKKPIEWDKIDLNWMKDLKSDDLL